MSLPASTRPLGRRQVCLVCGMLLAGCGITRAPPARLYLLPVATPAGLPSSASATSAAVVHPIWEIAASVVLPEYLDREAVVVGEGDTRLRALIGHRWAEPLRDSVPRLLRHDLQLLRGAESTWAAPAPAGVAIDRRLQVEVLALHADAKRRAFTLRARWWLIDPLALNPPLQGSVAMELPVDGADPEVIVGAHRRGLWLLAERIAHGA